jgi:hypothetical protein
MRALIFLAPLLLSACAETLIMGEGEPEGAAGELTAEGDPVGDGPSFYLVADNPCTDPCTFRASTNLPVDRVRYEADGWVIGESGNDASGWAISYDFQIQGDRLIKAYGIDHNGVQVGAAGSWIEVRGEDGSSDDDGAQDSGGALPEVPYFYQFANASSPSVSCQNTAAAMVLAWVGWSGVPDDLTGYWGTRYAQEPAGLADMFNVEARWQGLDDRLEAHTSGSIGGMKALLDRGLPVIVHGYFTRAGHVVVVLGYDQHGYWVNDPAGTWNERFMGGYPYGWEPNGGHAVYYDDDAFEAAVATSDGSTYLPLWYHELY